MSIATYNNDEEFDFDDEEDDLEPRLGPSGPSWRFTISISVLSMFLGVIAGIVGDGSAEVINGFYERSGPTRRAIANIQTDTSSLPALKPAPLQPGWFPDNNHVEWSTSLRPNEQPAAIDVRNESRSENRRILFQMVDGRTYRLAATLFVKSGSQAVIRLPIGAYRIDVASSPTEMPWEEAKAVIPIPRFALQLGEADNEPSPRNRIFIDEEGKVRPSIKPSKPSPVAEKRSKRRSSDPDYGELTEKSLKEEDESEDSETFFR